MRLHDGEPIAHALRRFKKLVEQHKRRGKPHKPTPWWYEPHFVRNTEIRRAKEYRKWWKSRLYGGVPNPRGEP
jgi:ribosomal protein S21